MYRLSKSILILFVLVSLSSCVITNQISHNKDYEYIVDPSDLSMEPVIQGGHSQTVTGIDWSSDGEFYVTSSTDRTALIWKKDGSLVRKLNTFQEGILMSAAFHPDGRYVAVGGKYLYICDAVTGEVVWSEFMDYDNVNQISFSPDGRFLAIGVISRVWRDDLSTPGFLRVYDFAQQKPVLQLDKNTSISGICFSPDSRSLFASVYEGELLKFNTEKFKKEETRVFVRHLTGLDIHPFGKYLCLGFSDGALSIADINSLEIIKENTIQSASDGIVKPEYFPDGKQLFAYIRSDSAKSVCLLDVDLNKQQQTTAPSNLPVFGSSVLPDGSGVMLGAGYLGSPGIFYSWNPGQEKTQLQENKKLVIYSLLMDEENKTCVVGTSSSLVNISKRCKQLGCC